MPEAKLDMKRGTPSAKLLGSLLWMIRSLEPAMTMQQVASRLGKPAATVSQIEKGQRALKEDKLADWAVALDLREKDVRELWVLCQGLVPAGDRLVSYTDAAGSQVFSSQIEHVLRDFPGLEPLYRHAARIQSALNRAVLYGQFDLWPEDFSDFQDGRDRERQRIGLVPEDARDLLEEFIPMPVISAYEDGFPRYGVGVPNLRDAPIDIRMPKDAAIADDLGEVLQRLTETERERVRGYVDAILESRR